MYLQHDLYLLREVNNNQDAYDKKMFKYSYVLTVCQSNLNFLIKPRLDNGCQLPIVFHLG